MAWKSQKCVKHKSGNLKRPEHHIEYKERACLCTVNTDILYSFLVQCYVTSTFVAYIFLHSSYKF